MANILIVDDRIAAQHFLGVLLGSFGHHVIRAHDGNEALEAIRQFLPDLVISDVLLRTMNGYEFVKKMRSNMTCKNIPVIFWVAECYEPETKAAAAELDVKYVVPKSASPEVIMDAVNGALSREVEKDSAARIARFYRHRLNPPSDLIDPNATVSIVDDDLVLSQLIAGLMLKARLKVQVYHSAEEFLLKYRDGPGCLLLDLCLPEMSGVELLESLRSRRIQVPAIILTGQGDITSAQLAMKLRALDFLEKSVDPRTLLARVYYGLQQDFIQRGKHAQSESILKRMSALTARERDLIDLLIDGRASKEIASELRISVRTVANHRRHLMVKTGAINLADLVRMSMIARDS